MSSAPRRFATLVATILATLLTSQPGHGEPMGRLVAGGYFPSPEVPLEVRMTELRAKEEELLRVGVQMKHAVLARDVRALWQLGNPFDDDTPNDAASSPSELADQAGREMLAELEDPGSEEHCFLFDTSCLRKLAPFYGGIDSYLRTSIREFFERNEDVAVTVRFGAHNESSIPFARVIFYRPSFKAELDGIEGAELPERGWARDFVSSDFTCDKACDYLSGVFNSAILEGC